MRYDPDFHSSVVRNMREYYARLRAIATVPELTLDDYELWDVFEAFDGVDLGQGLEGEEKFIAEKFTENIAPLVVGMLEAQREKPSETN